MSVLDVPRLLDEIGANATVAPLTRLVDGWLCKSAPGLPFRRSNTTLPAPGAGADPHRTGAVLDVIEAWYGSMGARVLVQVSSADPAVRALDDLLAARGYEVEAPVDILVAESDRIAEVGERSGARLLVSLEEQGVPTDEGPSGMELPVQAGVDEGWAHAYADVFGEDEVWRHRVESYGRMLEVLGTDALAVAAHPAGDRSSVAGVGFAVLERGWAGVFGMGTKPEWRRRGVGGALLGALAAEARRRHAQHLYLQVETDNEPAQQLYGSMGFTRSHGYHYRVRSAPA